MLSAAVAVTLTAGTATADDDPASKRAGPPAEGLCDPSQPTYSGKLDFEGQQRMAYVFCALDELMYVADTYPDGEGATVIVNGGERQCTDADGANNGATLCDWALEEGTYLDLCLYWAGACRSSEWATASGYCLPRPRVDPLSMRTRVVGGTHKRATRSRYRERVRVRGWLRTPEGAPVAGTSVCVSTRVMLPDAPFLDDDLVTTDERGRFTYTVPRGPSRRVHFVHRVSGGAVADSVLVSVRAPVRLRPSKRSLRNGQALLLQGELLAGPIPARRGPLVELQADRGNRWQTFGTTRADEEGRYRFRYRFTRTEGVQRYRLRARVPAQPAYPYAAGDSKPVRVRVSG